MSSNEPDVCYICLGESPTLLQPCGCRSLKAHRACLARWQLQSAGTTEENTCRLCSQLLPDWREAFATFGSDVVPVMSIQFNSHTYWLECRPGTGGAERFQDNVRHLLGLDQDQPFDITFECRMPGTEESRLELQGLHTYEAAVYCACLTASQRQQCLSEGSCQQPTASLSDSNSSSSVNSNTAISLLQPLIASQSNLQSNNSWSTSSSDRLGAAVQRTTAMCMWVYTATNAVCWALSAFQKLFTVRRHDKE